jgi:hypothetical protein
MKRNLVLASLFLFGLVLAAAPAHAQVAFQLSTLQRTIRPEGLTEAVGAVTLAATTSGGVSVNSTISIAYGSVATTILAGTGSLSVTKGGVFASGPCTAPPAPISTCTISGNNLTLVFAGTTFTNGDSIVVSGVRVNANGAGKGATINAVATATVPSGDPPITFFLTNQGPVAIVANATTNVTVTPATGGILTCTASSTGEYQVQIDEAFNQAFTSASDEAGFGAAPVGATTVDSLYQITFANVPIGVTISFDSFSATGLTPDPDVALSLTGETAGLTVGPTLTAGAPGGAPVALTSAAGAQTLVFLIDVTATSTTGANEMITANFSASTAATIALGGASVNASVSLTSTATSTNKNVPQFATNVQGQGFVFGVSDCVSDLLFPWVAADAPGAGQVYDTGIAIANTTVDSYGPNGTSSIAKPQSGACTLTGFNFTTGMPTASAVTGPVAPGETWAQPLAELNATWTGFRGYVTVVCDFQNAHGFAFITENNTMANGVTQGYLALIVPNPNISARSPKALGESLGF